MGPLAMYDNDTMRIDIVALQGWWRSGCSGLSLREMKRRFVRGANKYVDDRGKDKEINVNKDIRS